MKLQWSHPKSLAPTIQPGCCGLGHCIVTECSVVALQSIPSQCTLFYGKSLFNSKIDFITSITLNQSAYFDDFCFLGFHCFDSRHMAFYCIITLVKGDLIQLWSALPPKAFQHCLMPSVKSALYFCEESDLDWIGSTNKWRWVDWVPITWPLV